MNNNILNEDYIKTNQQPDEKTKNSKIYVSSMLESQIIKKLISLEQVIDTSVKYHEDKPLTLTKKIMDRKWKIILVLNAMILKY